MTADPAAVFPVYAYFAEQEIYIAKVISMPTAAIMNSIRCQMQTLEYPCIVYGVFGHVIHILCTDLTMHGTPRYNAWGPSNHVDRKTTIEFKV